MRPARKDTSSIELSMQRVDNMHGQNSAFHICSRGKSHGRKSDRCQHTGLGLRKLRPAGFHKLVLTNRMQAIRNVKSSLPAVSLPPTIVCHATPSVQ
jgi:hypothetical protein